MRLKAGIKISLFFLLLLCAATFYHSKSNAQSLNIGCGFNQFNDYICPEGETPIDRPNPFYPGSPPAGASPIPDPISVTPPDVSNLPACEDSDGGDAYEQFLEHLKLREGVVNCVYRDSLGYPTVGVGHLVKPEDNLQVGDCISDAQVDQFLQQDAAWAWSAANQQAQEAGVSSSCFIIALGSVNYQLGSGWRSKFPNTWNMIKNGQYCEAAAALEDTLWNQQTPVRVDDFQAALYQQAADAGTPCL